MLPASRPQTDTRILKMKGRGKYIDIKADDGGLFRGYLSVPEEGGEPKGPGIVLIQEIFGVNDNMRQLADMYADQGYICIVPDLFWRQEPGLDLPYSDLDKGRSLAMAMNFDLAVKDILATVKHLKSMPEVQSKVGTVGFCLGGLFAFLAAARGGDHVTCAVSYYGAKQELIVSEAPNVKCPIMFHFGGQDRSIPMEVVKAVQDTFQGRDNAEVFVYPEAGHGFGSPFRTDGHYQKEPTELALKRTLSLLTKTLKD